MNSHHGKKKILLIEDELGFRIIYRYVLIIAGYEILEADDGEKGLQLLMEHRPALVLLDLNLPKVHGFDVLKKIKETESVKHIPVIVFSVTREEKDIEKAMALGAHNYAVKGLYTPKQILDKIEYVIKNAHHEKDHEIVWLGDIR